MANATLIGIDLGKHCFFVQAQGARGAQGAGQPSLPDDFQGNEGVAVESGSLP
jgi:hypothetical protein